MNYPVWDISWFGGGIPVALIATFHVFIAHFAVGGGLFLVLTEHYAYRSKDPRVLEYVRTHTRFFLLVTMVLGALTGVAIWLVISVLNPAATSLLIHTFVFAWGTEWVFFLVEILSLLIYYYTFERMKPGHHLTVGWIYFVAAWLSLFMINAIVAFMLTPGQWPETRSFWDGLFNPSFLPSLCFRTFLAFTLAGSYGLLTSTRIQDNELRQKMVRYCALWLVAPFALLLPSAWWYLQSIPPGAKEMVLGLSPEIPPFTSAFVWLTPLIILGGLLMIARLPRSLQGTMAILLLIIGFLHMGSFEMTREASRRPFIIHGHMYTNGILVSRLHEVKQKGVLAYAKWTKVKEVTSQNRIAAGRELFKLVCLECHSLGGPKNNIFERIQKMTPAGLGAVISRMGEKIPYMPPFPGTTQEAEALASFLFEGQKGRKK